MARPSEPWELEGSDHSAPSAATDGSSNATVVIEKQKYVIKLRGFVPLQLIYYVSLYVFVNREIKLNDTSYLLLSTSGLFLKELPTLHRTWTLMLPRLAARETKQWT